MDIVFANAKLRKSMESENALRRAYGKLAEAVYSRVRDLANLDNLSQAYDLPGRFEPLRANRLGQFSLRISANYRLVLEPANEPVPLTEDGGIDLGSVDAVRILGVEDYH